MKRGCRRDPKPNAGEEETDDSERLFIRLLTRLHRAGGSENPAAIFKTPDQRRCFGTKKTALRAVLRVPFSIIRNEDERVLIFLPCLSLDESFPDDDAVGVSAA